MYRIFVWQDALPQPIMIINSLLLNLIASTHPEGRALRNCRFVMNLFLRFVLEIIFAVFGCVVFLSWLVDMFHLVIYKGPSLVIQVGHKPAKFAVQHDSYILFLYT